jgi:hypothetical protein
MLYRYSKSVTLSVYVVPHLFQTLQMHRRIHQSESWELMAPTRHKVETRKYHPR